LNAKLNWWSLGNAAKHVTIASGEMQPVGGISLIQCPTRSQVDERSVGNAGEGMSHNSIACKHGADPPKNSVERTGVIPALEKIEMHQYRIQMLHQCSHRFQLRADNFEPNICNAGVQRHSGAFRTSRTGPRPLRTPPGLQMQDSIHDLGAQVQQGHYPHRSV
jgi:hypothetical protein